MNRPRPARLESQRAGTGNHVGITRARAQRDLVCDPAQRER